MKLIHPKSTFLYVNASLIRHGREHPKLYFEIDLYDESLRNYEVYLSITSFKHWMWVTRLTYTLYKGDMKIYYSPLGNRRFMLLPYRIQRYPICDLLESKNAIREIAQSLRNYSNFPLPSEERNVRFCDLFKPVISKWNCNFNLMHLMELMFWFQMHYFVHNFMVDKSYFYEFLTTGRYRAEFFVYERTKKEAVVGVGILANFVWKAVCCWCYTEIQQIIATKFTHRLYDTRAWKQCVLYLDLPA